MVCLSWRLLAKGGLVSIVGITPLDKKKECGERPHSKNKSMEEKDSIARTS